MKTIKVNAYNYQELNQDSKNKVNNDADECPVDAGKRVIKVI